MRLFMLEECNNKSLDLSSLDRLGEVITIFDRDTRRASIFEPEAYIREVATRLRDLNFCEEDAFVLVGAHTPCALAMMAIGFTSRDDTFNVAMFDATKSAYVLKTINFFSLETDLCIEE